MNFLDTILFYARIIVLWWHGVDYSQQFNVVYATSNNKNITRKVKMMFKYVYPCFSKELRYFCGCNNIDIVFLTKNSITVLRIKDNDIYKQSTNVSVRCVPLAGNLSIIPL